jgi:hypothetical protein
MVDINFFLCQPTRISEMIFRQSYSKELVITENIKEFLFGKCRTREISFVFLKKRIKFCIFSSTPIVKFPDRTILSNVQPVKKPFYGL